MSGESPTEKRLWLALVAQCAVIGGLVVFAAYRELGEGVVAAAGAGGVTFLGVAGLGLTARAFLSG
ncbi:hypothetical protein GCM10009647_069420 [Streptomyces sanglieri]